MSSVAFTTGLKRDTKNGVRCPTPVSIYFIQVLSLIYDDLYCWFVSNQQCIFLFCVNNSFLVFSSISFCKKQICQKCFMLKLYVVNVNVIYVIGQEWFFLEIYNMKIYEERDSIWISRRWEIRMATGNSENPNYGYSISLPRNVKSDGSGSRPSCFTTRHFYHSVPGAHNRYNLLLMDQW